MNIFKISPDTFLTGVHCPHCAALPMIFHWGKWHCPACNGKSATAHNQAVEDYFLLIKPTITSKEFREFTYISSLNTATRLLSNLDIPYKGERVKRVYFIALNKMYNIFIFVNLGNVNRKLGNRLHKLRKRRSTMGNRLTPNSEKVVLR